MVKKNQAGQVGEVVKRRKIVSAFAADIASFKKDPMVSALQKARKQMFNTGDDGIAAVTRLLSKRLDELKSKGPQA